MSKICPCRVTPVATYNLPDSKDNQQYSIAYSDCCKPLHQGIKQADSSEQLMRSRYSAFVMVLPEYIIKTTVPSQQHLLDKQAIKAWAEQTNWAGLEIINHYSKVGKRHAQVEFKAYYLPSTLDESQLSFHHELSTFVLIEKRHSESDHTSNTPIGTLPWYFIDPTTDMKITQKQPCICGSGEKFKRCCGKYI